jgi:hypothetical protein
MFLLRSGSFPNADDLLSFPRDDGRGLRPRRVGGVSTPDLLLLGSAQRRRPFSPPLTAHSQEKKEEKTPMGLVAWAPGVSSPSRICTTAAREATRKPRPAPGLTSRAAELAHASAAQAKPQESAARGRWVKSPSGWYQPPRLWRLGVRASRAGDRPIKRARAGAAG